VASGVVVVVVGVCNRSQMRTSKFTCLIFGVSIGFDPARNAQKEFLMGQSSRSHATYRRTISGWLLVELPLSSLTLKIRLNQRTRTRVKYRPIRIRARLAFELLKLSLIRPHRQRSVLDVSYCYRCLDVAYGSLRLSLCMSATIVSHAKNG